MLDQWEWWVLLDLSESKDLRAIAVVRVLKAVLALLVQWVPRA